VAFRALQDIDPTYKFSRHLEEHGGPYKAAWDARNLAGSVLEPTDLTRSMQILDSAQARAQSLHGYAESPVVGGTK